MQNGCRGRALHIGAGAVRVAAPCAARRVYECALSNSAYVESEVAARASSPPLERHSSSKSTAVVRRSTSTGMKAARSGCTGSGKQQCSGSLREATRRSIGPRVVDEGEVISRECKTEHHFRKGRVCHGVQPITLTSPTSLRGARHASEPLGERACCVSTMWTTVRTAHRALAAATTCHDLPSWRRPREVAASQHFSGSAAVPNLENRGRTPKRCLSM